MKIGLYDLDSIIANLALMKISAYHKNKGDSVQIFRKAGLFNKQFDEIYASSVFTYSDKSYVTNDMICGGSGFDLTTVLPQEIDDCFPDYDIYPDYPYSMGFLTRGCIRKCSHCIVPQKEGYIKPYRDIRQIIRKNNNKVILMDNNILACEYGIKQIEKIIKLNLRIDFNQGLDCRLINDKIAKLLSKVKWLKPLRLSCDDINIMKPLQRAVELLRWYNVKPSKYFVYVLAKDYESTVERLKFLKGLYLDPFVQPYISYDGKKSPRLVRELARWVNMKNFFNTIPFNRFLKARNLQI